MPCSSSRSWRILLAACLGAGILAGPAAQAASASPTPTWSRLSPAASPPALVGASAAYDSADDSVVLFGGRLPDGALSDDTWLWNGSAWSEATTYGSVPEARTQASMAFDPALDQLILFGGEAASGSLLDDTWEWNGASWIEISPLATPGARDGAAMATDSAGNLILFGGYGTSNAPATTPPTSTTTTTPTTTPPSTTPTTVLGLPIGTTTTDPSTTTTTTTPTTTPTSTPGDAHGDHPGVLADTWILSLAANGADDWQPANPTMSPGPVADASMAQAGSVTILFGGVDAEPGHTGALSNATWTWDGSTWQRVGERRPPAARDAAVLVDDTSLGELLLFGGQGAHAILGDTWALSPHGWERLAAHTPPGPRAGSIGVYDAATLQLVLFGGLGRNAKPMAETDVLTRNAPPRITTTPTTTVSSTPTTDHPGAGTRPPSPGRSSPSTTSASTSGRRGSATTVTTTSGNQEGGATPPGSTPPVTDLGTSATLHRGNLLVLRGHGFLPGARITVTFHSVPVQVVAITHANGSGAFSVVVTVPADAAMGLHHFVASGEGPGGLTSLITQVRVVALSAGHGISGLTTGVLTLIAIAIPLGTWAAFGGIHRLRRRPVPA